VTQKTSKAKARPPTLSKSLKVKARPTAMEKVLKQNLRKVVIYKNNPRRFLKAFLVLMKLLSLSQFYAPKLFLCSEKQNN